MVSDKAKRTNDNLSESSEIGSTICFPEVSFAASPCSVNQIYFLIFNWIFSGPAFTIEGQFGVSITDQRTLTSTRTHDQGDKDLCWDYAATSSIRHSLRIKIGKFFKSELIFVFFFQIEII